MAVYVSVTICVTCECMTVCETKCVVCGVGYMCVCLCVCVNRTPKRRSYSTEMKCSKTIRRKGQVISFLFISIA